MCPYSLPSLASVSLDAHWKQEQENLWGKGNREPSSVSLSPQQQGSFPWSFLLPPWQLQHNQQGQPPCVGPCACSLFPESSLKKIWQRWVLRQKPALPPSGLSQNHPGSHFFLSIPVSAKRITDLEETIGIRMSSCPQASIRKALAAAGVYHTNRSPVYTFCPRLLLWSLVRLCPLMVAWCTW